jgi:hypothetical protein
MSATVLRLAFWLININPYYSFLKLEVKTIIQTIKLIQQAPENI